uniref:Chitin-binding type-2 domain-containing protein n=1 Tax=Strigamia maritima TaxID=126957 RepID=T1J0R7_STRMM
MSIKRSCQPTLSISQKVANPFFFFGYVAVNDSNDEPTTTTRRSRHARAAAARVKNVHVTRQAQTFEPDSGAPGAPGVSDAPEDSQSTDTFAQPSGVQHSTGRQAPLAAPRPQAPPPAAAGPASLTLPDGADVILGDIKPGFTCESKIYGYYADIFNDCKLFHVCVPVGDENGVTNPIQWSFVCGNQTLFNQEKLTCDYQENVDCSKSENFYSINENFGRPEDKAAVAPGGPAPVPAPTRDGSEVQVKSASVNSLYGSVNPTLLS